MDTAARVRQRALLHQEVRRGRRPSRRLRKPGRPREVPVHHKTRPAGQLSVRHVRGATVGTSPHPRVQRHNGQTDRGRLHRDRHRHLGRGGGPLDPRGRRTAGRQGARRVRLRPVHRRTRRALRRGEAGLHGDPGLRRHDRAAGAAHQRLPARGHHGDPVLPAHPDRRVRARRARPARDLAAGGHPGRGTVDRADAPGDRAAAGPRRGGHLRPVRGDGTGRRAGVRGHQGRPAHLGGPLLSRGDRPDRGDRAGRRARPANCCSPR